MSTLVLFHAHPDDETITTGGTAARAAAEGHRVVLVVATGGEHGERPDDLGPDESLVARRRAETERAASVLGIHRVAFLGYEDSGMTGWEQNANPRSFAQAPVDEAAERLAAILREEQADVLTTYDWHGGYGHPDHVQVHRVGHAAAALAGVGRLYEATMNRDAVSRFMEAARLQGAPEDDVFDPNGPMDDGNPMGTPEAELTTQVDVTPYVVAKREALRAHASQVTDTSFFLQIPDDAFATAFGTEWFVRVGATPGIHEDWLFG
jgi:LmbE family N-acetylglucosaminyl deacetylase